MILFILLLAQAFGAEPEILKGRVLRAVDGDTIKVMVLFDADIQETRHRVTKKRKKTVVTGTIGPRHYSARQTVTMRIHGIDAPEKRQAYGKVSSQFIQREVVGKTVQIVIYNHADRYGRMVADVVYDGEKRLSHESIAAGMSWWYQQYDRRDQDLQNAQNTARVYRKGLWADARPVAPWEWRKIRK